MGPLPESDFDTVDPLFRKEIAAWVNHGVLPTSIFLESVLRGDLGTAFRKGTMAHWAKLVSLLRFLDRVDDRCWGSPRACAEWLHAGGLTGKARIVDEYNKAAGRDLPPRRR